MQRLKPGRLAGRALGPIRNHLRVWSLTLNCFPHVWFGDKKCSHFLYLLRFAIQQRLFLVLPWHRKYSFVLRELSILLHFFVLFCSDVRVLDKPGGFLASQVTVGALRLRNDVSGSPKHSKGLRGTPTHSRACWTSSERKARLKMAGALARGKGASKKAAPKRQSLFCKS